MSTSPITDALLAGLALGFVVGLAFAVVALRLAMGMAL